MRIDTATVLTIGQLRALIADAPDGASIDWAKTPKKHLTGECWCGCGSSTKSRFAPGHDSKFHSLAKQVARGLEEMPTDWVCDEAEADFMKWHDREVPKHEARMMEKAIKAAEKAKVNASKEVEEAEVAAPVERVTAPVERTPEKIEAPVVSEVTEDIEALLAEVTMS